MVRPKMCKPITILTIAIIVVSTEIFYFFSIKCRHQQINVPSFINIQPTKTAQIYPEIKIVTSKGQQFAVITVSTPLDNNFNYVFYAPLTALAWKRIGFETIVVVSGSRIEWTNNPVLRTVHIYLLDMNCIVLFLDTKPENRVMISQASRLFTASLLQETLHENDYVIIGDVDLWPINDTLYSIDQKHKILSLNSDCCPPFQFKNKTYKMLPMSNVGASVATWREITATNRFEPTSSDDILMFFENEFGPVVRQPFRRAGPGWYLDQWMLTILIHEWIDKHSEMLVQFVPRNIRNDRICRSRWNTATIENKTDAHLLIFGYNPEAWSRTIPLIELMYGQHSHGFNLSNQYFQDFSLRVNS